MSNVPPHNADAEMAVLGCVLLGPSILSKLIEQGLKPKHFHRDSHRAIFAAMVELHERGYEPDTLLVTSELARMRRNDLGRVVALCPNAVPSAGHWPQYAQEVRDLAQLRAVAIFAQRTINAIHSKDREALNENFDRLTSLGLPESWRIEPATVRPLRRPA